MGSVDLVCIATGLPILSEKQRCVFFFLVGKPGAWAPHGLPVPGVWNGHYPELDPGPAATTAIRELAALAQPDARDATIEARPRDVLLDVVAAAFSGARPVRTAAGDAITFRAALEDFYRVFAWDGAAPASDTPDASVDFLRFRTWFEATRAWGATDDGHQFERDDIIAMIDHAEKRLLAAPEPHRTRLAEAIATYRARGKAEEDDEKDDESPPAAEAPEDTFEARRLLDHLRAKLRERPGIDATALARTIEVYRTLQSLPASLLPAGSDFAGNVERWRSVIDRTGTADLPALLRALRGAR